MVRILFLHFSWQWFEWTIPDAFFGKRLYMHKYLAILVFWPYSCKAKKWGNTGSHPKPMSTFPDGNKKEDHKLSKAFYFIEISSNICLG